MAKRRRRRSSRRTICHNKAGRVVSCKRQRAGRKASRSRRRR